MSDLKTYDLIVIGGGPGGYEAAIRAGQLGMSVACVEMRINDGKAALGGTCLNVGCIPSKALLDSSHKYEMAKEEFAQHGIQTGEISMDVAAMQERKKKVVKQLTGGVAQLLKANGAEWHIGRGKVTKASDAQFEVEVTPHQGEAYSIQSSNLILASGSTPVDLKMAPVDNNHVVDSTGALEFESVPKRLGVIGAGVIGLELGSVWRRLGAEVVVFEAMDELLGMLDSAVSKEAGRLFKKQGLDIRLGVKVVETKAEADSVTLSVEQGGSISEERFDKVIVCTGRKAYTEGLLAPGISLATDSRGFIEVGEQCQTSIEGLYAIGDLVRGPMLAHKAMEEGMMVVERIHGEQAQVNYNTIIGVIYTHPEIAWVGLSEEAAKAQGYSVKTGHFPLAANGRALAAADKDGFIKIVADEATDRILGVHVIAAGAGDIVHQGMIAMEFGALSEDLQLMTFAHPTVSEAMHEAALSVDGRAIHAIQRKR